jgi:hypothetical protein
LLRFIVKAGENGELDDESVNDDTGGFIDVEEISFELIIRGAGVVRDGTSMGNVV